MQMAHRAIIQNLTDLNVWFVTVGGDCSSVSFLGMVLCLNVWISSTFPNFLETVVSPVSCCGGDKDEGLGHLLLSWCSRKASFSVLTHSILSKSRLRESSLDWSSVTASGGSGNLAQQVLTTSVCLQFALSKLQFPTLNSNP